MLLGFALYFPLWLLRARGAGDVKLLAAAGSLLGPQNTFAYFVIAALVGGVFGLALVLRKGALPQTAANIGLILKSLMQLRAPERTLKSERALQLPHAAVLFAAAWPLVLLLRSA